MANVLYTCGIENCASKHSYGPALRSGYMIHYILKGHGIFRVNDKTYHLRENEAFLIEQNILIYYEADENVPWEYCWIGFNGVKTKESLSRTKLSIDNPIFTFDEGKKLLNCMNSIITSSKITSNKDLLLISKLYKFLYLLCEIYPSNEINNTQNQQKYIEDALLFSKTFKKFKNCTPTDYRKNKA